MRNENVLLIGLFVLSLSGCSPTLLTSQDYDESLYHYSIGNPEKALESFPGKERGSFITTMEKAYLSLQAGKPDNHSLLQLVDSIEQRIRFRGSREVASLFYAETPEGYYASEHEIIWLHLLLSWGFSLNKEFEKGCVEARKASHLLSAPWSYEGRFDDAMLRILLGGLWTMCGSWEDAVIDFRKAYQLSPETTWLQELISRETAPRNLMLVLGGIGPQPYWDPDAELNVMRGLRNIGFTFQGLKSDLVLLDPAGNEIPMHLSPDSRAWYQRHFERDNAIHELIVDSHYTGKAAGTVTVESAKMATGYALGTTIVVGSIAVGGGLIYVILSNLPNVGSGAEYIIMLGGAIAYFGTKKGISIMTETTEDSVETIKKDLNAAATYRFVRYLPEYLWVGWSNADYSLNPGFTSQNQQQLIHPTWITNGTQSFVSFMPDIDSRKNTFALIQASWKSWKSQVEAYLSDSTHLVFWEKLAGSADQLMKLAHSNAFAINLEFTGTNHLLEINSQGITGTIQGGLFAQGPTYGIDLMNRTITAERAAMDSIIKLPPPLFVSNIFNEINKQIYNLKHRK